jgi:hypothetical protein
MVSNVVHSIGQKTTCGYMRISASIRDMTGKGGIPHEHPRTHRDGDQRQNGLVGVGCTLAMLRAGSRNME